MDKLEILNQDVNEYYERLEKIEFSIINQYTENLDYCIKAIQDYLNNNQGETTISEINRQIMNLGPLLYFALVGLEKVGIKEDISNQIRLAVYNSARAEATGTKEDKNSVAEEKSKQEAIINDLYSRCYKEIKVRCDMGQELLKSLKKVLSAKMLEMELTRVQVDSGGPDYTEFD